MCLVLVQNHPDLFWPDQTCDPAFQTPDKCPIVSKHPQDILKTHRHLPNFEAYGAIIFIKKHVAPSCKLVLARFSALLRIQDGADCGNIPSWHVQIWTDQTCLNQTCPYHAYQIFVKKNVWVNKSYHRLSSYIRQMPYQTPTETLSRQPPDTLKTPSRHSRNTIWTLFRHS